MKKYASDDLELAIIMHPLKKSRHQLIGKRFEIRINHISLKCLFDQPNLNSKQSKQMKFICEIEFEVQNIRWKENRVVDALNKKIHVATINISKSNMKARVINTLAKDEYYIQVMVCSRRNQKINMKSFLFIKVECILQTIQI